MKRKNLKRINQEEFIDLGRSWLTYDLVRDMPSPIDPIGNIQWQEEEISQLEETFLWIDIH